MDAPQNKTIFIFLFWDKDDLSKNWTNLIFIISFNWTGARHKRVAAEQTECHYLAAGEQKSNSNISNKVWKKSFHLGNFSTSGLVPVAATGKKLNKIRYNKF